MVAGDGTGERKGERSAPASVTFLHQLNEVQEGLLLAATAEGAVRIWRNYTIKAEQRLATAWQVCTTPSHSCLAAAQSPLLCHALGMQYLSLPGRSALLLPGCKPCVAFVFKVLARVHRPLPEDVPF